MRRVVRGFWGPRAESAEALAVRWKQTLDRLAGLLPAAGPGTAGPWTWQQAHEVGAATVLSADEASLLTALRAEQAADGWSDRTGYGLSLSIENEAGWEVEVRGSAGGASEFVLQSVILGISVPEGAQLPAAELLALVAEEWAPDFGDVTDDDVLDALEDEADFIIGEPSVGWCGYLSPARAALVPDDLTAARKELPDGGVLFDIAAPSTDTDTVVETYVRLREAGALEPLPTPMDRSML
ncbi:hypothetical protein NGF19_27330 [Streptomyces sp. RY43-2]|uniref:Immunity protein 52 domain-containing protein n=1 Tax=Streptomyces macrolidinus TaxID=2952607 RepID=A0ABT0ZLI4_9ACTN|nr:hypothetical protein [Streptomyces macrolidinus]MCN9244450.1 hypothetical protein [Streptomyces macrolidinus]